MAKTKPFLKDKQVAANPELAMSFYAAKFPALKELKGFREEHQGRHEGQVGDMKGGSREHVAYEHHRVTYHDKSGKAHDSSKAFTDRSKAEAYAAKGNAIDKVGGSYKVTKVDEKLD